MNLQGSTVIEQGAPVVVNGTAVLSPILNNSIDIEGSVTDDRQDPVTERGFVWNTTGSPTINDQKNTYGSGQGDFTGTINNLASGTYYLRAFATNSAGTSYGNEQTVLVPTQSSTLSVTESISNFNKTCASIPSDAQSFSVSGTNLSQGIVISVVSGLEYSLNGSTYQNSLTLNPVSGTVAATTVYVRMTVAQTSDFSGIISISSSGALGYSINVTGTYTDIFSITSQPAVVSSSVCKDSSPETISFTSTASGYTIQWYSNSSNSYTGATLISGATSNSLSLPTSIAGTRYYFAKLTSNSGSCNVDTDIVTQTVTPTIGTIGWITGTINLASDATTATYTIPVVSGATSYVWNLPSGMTRQSQTGNSITVAIAASFTSGTVSVYASSNCGVTATRSFYSTKLTGGISFGVSGNSVLCTNSSATYTATTVANGVYTWTVPTGMSIVSGQGTNEISVSTDGSFISGNIKATCATSQYTYQSNYAVSGVALPSGISGPSNLCGLTTTTYSVTNVPGTTYIWSLPEGMTISGVDNTASINVLISGTVNGSVTVRAENSCGLSAPRFLAVNSAPIVGGIYGANRVCGEVQVTLDSQGNILDNTALNSYTYSVAALAGAESYIWTVPTGATIQGSTNTNSITVSYDLVNFESGNITVQAVNSTCGAGPTRSLSVSAVTGSITGPTNLCSLTSATYSVPADIGTGFVWSLPEGMSVSSGTGTSNVIVNITGPVNTSSTVSVQFTTACGGSKTLSLGVSCSDYTNLVALHCGATNVLPTQWVNANQIAGATSYLFNIYDATGSNLLFTIERPLFFFRFYGSNFTYGATYQVGVQVKQGAGEFGLEGSRCTVTLGNLPTTSLVVSHCGATGVTPIQWINANPVSGATAYRFNIYSSTGVYLFTIDRSTYIFRFYGSDFTYDTTYQVGVQVKQGAGEYGAEGGLCNVTIESKPTTNLIASQCTATLAPDDNVYPIEVTGATSYAFDIYDGSGNTLITTIENSYPYFRFSQMNYTLGAKYLVKVRVKFGTNYGLQGSGCLVQLINTIARQEQVKVVEEPTETKFLALQAYPNPFTSTFSITPIEGETATLFYQVYDVTGKMIESSAIAANEIAQHTIGDYYSVGMYLVIVRQGATTQTFKMVKQ
ncbi:T9SS type A sorting domain-containing protein [Flavobacterium sp.]|uniref:T9SS type A sorting domain-containing protein n=1 Tax=Flavobacterium sp. TaxID=239 RepID=UPI0040476509